jgi:peptidoglycan/LPS O-acetylase OafA/YrhL
VSVILDHAGFKLFRGGFVGVDVFFVISGYLISTIIITDLEAGKFSIINFYERRARRILPALFLVMAVCIPFACSWLFPGDVKNFAASVIAVSMFVSNILFWRDSSYFGTAAQLKPLLHTWSLAVEEQFYVIYPVFLILAWRLGRRWTVALLGLISAASLAAAQWGAFNRPSAAFYLLPTRGWELAIGAFIAFYFAKQYPPVHSQAVSQSYSVVGLLLIVCSVFVFNDSIPFPSLYTLAPTIGAALIILFATPKTLVGRLLGGPVFVGIGLISYSAYLWHQPLFAFARQRSLHEPSSLVYAVLCIATLVIAYISWRFVEKPFRQKGVINRTRIFSFAAAGSVLFVSLGLLGYFAGDHIHRRDLREQLSRLEYRVGASAGLSPACVLRFTTSPECRTDDKPEVLLWGDSFAGHLAQGLLASYPKIKLIQMTFPVCGPVLNIAPSKVVLGKQWGMDCIKDNDQVFEYMKQSKTLKYVVMSSPFTQYVNDDSQILLRNGTIISGKDNSLEYFKETLRNIERLGITPVIVSPPPENGEDIGRCLSRAVYFNEDTSLCDFRLGDSIAYQQNIIRLLSILEKEVKVIWLADVICENDICHASSGGTFIYGSGGHLSDEGSVLVWRRLNASRVQSLAHL